MRSRDAFFCGPFARAPKRAGGRRKHVWDYGVVWFLIYVLLAGHLTGIFARSYLKSRDGFYHDADIAGMVYGTASKPFVYRVLVPGTARLIMKVFAEGAAARG